jgi:photosystem II stability/assembly factor-like uncharacterized protein
MPSLECCEERMLLTNAIALNPLTWTPVGPSQVSVVPAARTTSGQVLAEAISPNFDGHGTSAMFLGTGGGGIWRSTNYNSANPTWTPLTDSLGVTPTSELGLMTVSSLAVDPNHPAVIYGGTSHGILKSINGGNTWTVLGQSALPLGSNIVKVIVDPTDLSGNTIYAARYQGIFRSTNGGSNWNLFESGLPSMLAVFDLDYTVSTSHSLTLYAGLSSLDNTVKGIWRMTGGATRWAPMNINLIDHVTGNVDPITSMGTITFAADHTLGAWDGVYAAVENQPTGNMLNIFKLGTLQGVPTWLPASGQAVAGGLPKVVSFQGGYDQSIGLAPDGTIYLGGQYDVFESPDNGVHWQRISQDQSQNGPHVDHHAWAFSLELSSPFLAWVDAYDGSDGGIYRFSSQNRTWRSLNTPELQTYLVNGVGLNPVDPNSLLTANQDNGIARRASSTGTWGTTLGGDGGLVRFDPDARTNGQFAYEAHTHSQGFLRSSDGGQSWTNIGGNIPLGAQEPVPYQMIFAIDPANTTHLLAGVNHVYETSDRGDHWRSISPALDGSGDSHDLVALAYAPGNDNVIYVVYSDGKVFETTDHGGNGGAGDWKEVDAGTHWAGTVTQIMVDPTNSSMAYVTTNGGTVWRTTNGGTTWQNITGDLPPLSVNAIALDHVAGTADPRLFVGTDVGVYSTAHPGGATHWTRYGIGLPDVPVTDLQFEARTGRLAAGTYGRGVWEIVLPRVLGQFAPTAGVAGYYTPNDNFEHAIVPTANGLVNEVYFGNPQHPGPYEDPLNATSPLVNIVGVAGYFDPGDGFEHVLAATADGKVHEIRFGNPQHPGNFLDPQGPLAQFGAGSVVALAGYYTPGDGFEHAIVATSDGKVSEVFFGNPKYPGEKGQDVLARFDPSSIVSVAGYTTGDGFQHVLVLTTDGVVSELRWRPDVGFQTGTA